MIIHEGYENLEFSFPIVTIGVFDGVHKGHRFLLDILVSNSRAQKGESVVITFDTHPRLVLQSDNKELFFLSTMEEKARLLKEAGIDHLVIIDFSEDFSNMEACDFVQKILIERIRTRHLIVGYDHHFGRSGKGNYEMIKKCARSSDLVVEQVRGLESSNMIVSSTAIRKALLTGMLDEANNMLGYSYSLSGSIVEGKKIGRSIGFPTANIKPDHDYKLIPGDGVYAVMVNIEGTILPGMLSIGNNPTIKQGNNRTIEVHIINFDKDIYDKNIMVTFKKWLRSEIRFENLEQLALQMNTDREQTLKLLGLI